MIGHFELGILYAYRYTFIIRFMKFLTVVIPKPNIIMVNKKQSKLVGTRNTVNA